MKGRRAQARERRLLCANVALSAVIAGALGAMAYAYVYPHGVVAQVVIAILR